MNHEKNEEPQGEESEPERDRSTLYFLIAVALILVVGAFAYFSHGTPRPETTKKVVYNGFEFEYQPPLWMTKWQNDGQVYILTLRYNPYETENVTVESTGTWTEGKELYITFDPENNRGSNFSAIALAATELSLSLRNTFGVKPIGACTKNTTDCNGFPIIKCANANVAFGSTFE